jgi:hypothetical protein
MTGTPRLLPETPDLRPVLIGALESLTVQPYMFLKCLPAYR